MNIAIISGASSGIGFEIAKEIDLLCLDEIWLISSSEQKTANNLESFVVILFLLNIY